MALLTESSHQPCPACAMVQARALCGAYNLRCVLCCARLVVSARPNRAAQQAFLYCITRRKENPSQAAVLAAIKKFDAARSGP